MNEAKPMCLNDENLVVMSNALIKGKSNLSLNELKLLRLTIMQVVAEAKDFQTYKVNIVDLAKLLNIDRHYIYREVDTFTTHLMKELVYVGDGNPKHKWLKFPWVDMCRYADGVLTIRLSDQLKPYLIGLSELYTQYVLKDVILLKTVYAVRLYELIRQEMKYQKVYADKTATVYLSLKDIRTATDTLDKYDPISMFRARVIDNSLKEIKEKLGYDITYKMKKESRKIVGINFFIQSVHNIRQQA